MSLTPQSPNIPAYRSSWTPCTSLCYTIHNKWKKESSNLDYLHLGSGLNSKNTDQNDHFFLYSPKYESPTKWRHLFYTYKMRINKEKRTPFVLHSWCMKSVNIAIKLVYMSTTSIPTRGGGGGVFKSVSFPHCCQAASYMVVWSHMNV
jgi:hypothetical protein